MSQVLLKARPTVAQLANRLESPIPDGIELYLDRQDLIGERWLDVIKERISSLDVSRSFVWIVEAPIRTLGEQFFDLTNHDDDHRETIRRVLAVGAAIGAVAANIHVVAPTLETSRLSVDERKAALLACSEVLQYYVAQCQDFGMVPQVENIPPVGRMRESAYVFSPIGATPMDLVSLATSLPELRFTADVSHAALYLNWHDVPQSRVARRFQSVVDFYSKRPGATTLADFLDELGDRVTTIHVSNADGLFGEGLGYDDGPEDLDLALRPYALGPTYLVTETIERDPDRATGMREAQTRLLKLRDSLVSGSD